MPRLSQTRFEQACVDHKDAIYFSLVDSVPQTRIFKNAYRISPICWKKEEWWT